MNRDYRLELAQNTLKIIENGFYIYKDQKVDVAQLIENNVNATETIVPNDWEGITAKPIYNFEEPVEIEVKNCSTIEAIVNQDYAKIGVLNFASAKNPGGGFLGGASAQEESLARSSSLFASLTKDRTMYDYNKNQRSFLYSDYMIYSPNTVFWFDDNGNAFKNPILVDVITSPAPNKGAMLQHNRIEEMQQIESVFLKRMDYLMHYANLQKTECLVLGAWGCGVFRNESSDVAQWFKKVILQKYSKAFKKIVFAVYDTSEKKLNHKAFEDNLR
ncbi:MAG: TIGR02452 family protein [Flavobacteriales bacterium]|nr:TIGR02452 family protein [Flavobacteriales bacterium]